MREIKSKLDISLLPILLLPIAIVIGQVAISLILLACAIIFLTKFKDLKIIFTVENFFNIFFILIISTLINSDLEKQSELKNFIIFTLFKIFYSIFRNL